MAQEVAGLDGVRKSCRGAVQRAILRLRDGLRQFVRGQQGIRSLCGSLKAVIRRGLDDDEEEGYYSSSEDESEVNEDTARQGLGEAGSVTIAASIWNRCVPSDLLDKYRQHLGKRRVADSGRGRRAKVLGCMFSDVRVTTRGVKRTGERATVTAFLRPKTAQKCRLLLNPEEIHAADGRRPPRFRLPRLEGLGHWMARRRGRKRGTRRVYLAKIDLTNAYWSIKLPRRWRRLFVVRVNGRAYRITRLPFGWKFSPSICQQLVDRLVRSALRGRSMSWTYLDDILGADAPKKRLKQSMRAMVWKLERAGFIISPKSVLKPQRELDFVGKQLRPKTSEMANKPGTLAAALRAWLKVVARGRARTKAVLSMLGKVNWAVRPSGGAGPMLAGAYRAVQRADGGAVDFTRAAARGVGTAVMLAHMPHSFAEAKTEGFIFFSDAAERPERAGRFRVGVVGLTGTYKSLKCPGWVRTLQQAELWGVYAAMKLCVYIFRNVSGGGGGAGFRVGTDSEVARHQVVKGHASSGLPVQQRILRRIFWLRSWSGCSVGVFRVPSPQNPADPHSRLHSFPSRQAAVREADQRKVAWAGLCDPFSRITFIPPSHWEAR